MAKIDDLLADPSAERRFLVALYPFDPSTNAVLSGFISTHGFTTEPTDTPASFYFQPRVKQLPAFSQSMFSEGKLSGRTKTQDTQIVMTNDDGAFDLFNAYAFTGRELYLYMGGADFSLGDYFQVGAYLMKEPTFTDNAITIPLTDYTALMDKELQVDRYKGTGGAEGSSDLKDRLKPDPYGCCRKVPPVYLGLDAGGRHVFGVGSGDKGILAVLGVWDRGSPLTFVASNPLPGEYSVDLATASITLGGAFVGPIQADVLGRIYLGVTSTSAVVVGEGAKSFAVITGPGAVEQQLPVGARVRCRSTADPAGTWMDGVVTGPRPGGTVNVTVDAARGSGTVSSWLICPWGTVTGIMSSIANRLGFLFDTSAFIGFNTVQPSTVGYWTAEGGNGLQILDAIADGTGCFWRLTADNYFQVGRIDPALSFDIGLDDSYIETIERTTSEAPNYEIVLKMRRNWSVLTTDQVAGVAGNSGTQFTQEWQTVKFTNNAVLARYPASKSLQVESLFDDGNGGVTEMFRLATIFGTRREYFKTIFKGGLKAPNINVGVFVASARYGLRPGRTLLLIDLTVDYDTGKINFGTWG